jgi:hypothetical protein
VTVPVRYHCPTCGQVFSLERAPSIADKSVTPYPLEGWEYESPAEAFEDADGVILRCGESSAEGLRWPEAVVDGRFAQTAPCGAPIYLSFVRYEMGREVEPVPEYQPVDIADAGPRWGPPGPRL